MLFNRKIFVHIPKNAGMTIRHSPFLKDKILVNDQNTHKSREYTQELLDTMAMTGDHHGIEHARWRDLNPSYTGQHGAFGIIRNPWSRVVSRYFFAKKVIQVEKKADPTYADVSSFEAFIEERHKWGNHPFMWHRAIRGWYPAFDHVSDEKGNVKCDMLRFEHLNAELIAYFKIPQMSRARNVTALNEGTYQKIYNDKTIQIVADWYKKDIDHWGFDFNSAATKNYWRLDNE
jgi:hypothetical protein|tara:strand:+ start:1004 stop:1699 length:696 start_codon:yes stop_codon:yes gene_type:complete